MIDEGRGPAAHARRAFIVNLTKILTGTGNGTPTTLLGLCLLERTATIKIATVYRDPTGSFHRQRDRQEQLLEIPPLSSFCGMIGEGGTTRWRRHSTTSAERGSAHRLSSSHHSPRPVVLTTTTEGGSRTLSTSDGIPTMPPRISGGFS